MITILTLHGAVALFTDTQIGCTGQYMVCGCLTRYVDKFLYCSPFIQISECRMVVWPAGNAYDSAVYGFIWPIVPLSAVFVIGARCVLQDFCKPPPKKERSVVTWPAKNGESGSNYNQQLSLLVPRHLWCSGKGFIKDIVIHFCDLAEWKIHAAEYATHAFIALSWVACLDCSKLCVCSSM